MQYNVASNNYAEEDYFTTVENSDEISNRHRMYNYTNAMITFKKPIKEP